MKSSRPVSTAAWPQPRAPPSAARPAGSTARSAPPPRRSRPARLESNGEMTRGDGGFRVKATKRFASQAAIGDVLVTSSVYPSPEAGEQVLHFPVPMKAEGVCVLNDWHTLGMRATGSHTVRLDGVFVPDSSITLRRPRGVRAGDWTPGRVWSPAGAEVVGSARGARAVFGGLAENPGMHPCGERPGGVRAGDWTRGRVQRHARPRVVPSGCRSRGERTRRRSVGRNLPSRHPGSDAENFDARRRASLCRSRFRNQGKARRRSMAQSLGWFRNRGR
jgi:hypothetical protein